MNSSRRDDVKLSLGFSDCHCHKVSQATPALFRGEYRERNKGVSKSRDFVNRTPIFSKMRRMFGIAPKTRKLETVSRGLLGARLSITWHLACSGSEARRA